MQALPEENIIADAIAKAVQAGVEMEVKKLIERAKASLEGRVSEIAAGVTIRLMKHVSMEVIGPELVMRIQMEGFNDAST